MTETKNRPFQLTILALAGALLLTAVSAAATDDHLVLCEAVVTPTANEFIEIFNPTGAPVSLDDYYLSDDEDYALLPGASGSGPAPSIASSDFIVQFPPGAMIPAGGVVVVAFNGAGFAAAFGTAADYEIHPSDATPDMIATDVGSSTAGLTNSGENAVLFVWDGASDLVTDVDMVNIGTPSSTNDIADKTGLTIDGPDGDTTASMYLVDAFTMPQQAGDPGFGASTKRLLLESGNEATGGGNGITGDDETSEQITATWDAPPFTAPDPGTCGFGAPPPPDLLLSEIVVTPTAGEFVEIHNPTAGAIDLSDVFLTDATFAVGGTFYYNIAAGANAGGGGFGDFHARFPDGASIASGEFQTISLNGSTNFFLQYGFDPTYELYEDGAGADAVPDMREALPGSINGQGGLSNAGEVVILYTWDGASDLVQDIDYAVWGDKVEAVDKTGVSVDGPDGDAVASPYLPDTAIGLQDVVSGGGHAGGDSFQRVDFAEGIETQAGGNGITGSDETSEDLSVTWQSQAATPGAGPPAPPVVVVVINEIMQNPSAVSDNNGEWFELVNTTPDPVDVEGWTIKDDGSNVHVISSGGSLIIAPGGYLVLGRDANSGTNGGVSVDYQYSNIFLGNGSDELILLDGASSEIDRVEWDNGATFPDPNGASMALKSPALDNNVGANWCESSTPFGDGDRGTPGAANDCFARLVINEVDADQSGTDAAEFIEIYDGGDGGTDLTGLVVVLFNGSDDASYTPAIDLDGFATGGDGFFVICGDAANVPGCDLDVSPDTNLIQNGADAVALVAGDAADFPNDTPVTTDGLLDALVYDTDDGDDAGLLVLLKAGQPQVNERGGGSGTTHSNQRCPNGFGGQRNTDGYFQDTPTAGALNNCPPLEIYEIQGAGPASVYDGFVVGTGGDVVTAKAPDGFFMQTPSTGTDGDPDTSDGIFVFTGGAPGVAVGDLVDVTGEVFEFFGFTEIGGSPSVSVVGSGIVPTPVAFSATVPTPDPTAPSCAIEFECYEGMLVEIAEGTVTGPNQRFGTDPTAEVHIVASSDRAFREPGVAFPFFMPPIPTWDGNPEVFELDPDKLGEPNLVIPAGSTFSAIGALGFEFGGYELWPSSLTVTPAPLPVAVRAREPGELTVGSLNLFRLFDDVDDPPDGDRNDFVVSTAEYQRRLDKFCSYIDEVLDSPDILAVQEAESLGVLQDLADHIANDADCGAFVGYTPYLVEGNDIGTIDVGFLVRDNINVDAVTQLGKDETFVNPITLNDDILHDRPPLLLEGSCQLEFGTFPIAVMVVHNRSLGGIDGSEGIRVRVKRLSQAESIADKVQALQDADPDVRLVVTGDFNAFEFTDGYVDALGVITGGFDPATSLVCGEAVCMGDLVEPNLDNQVLSLDAGDRYSFIFRGTAQVLDHALTSSGLAAEVAGAEYGRGNADAAVDLINDDSTLLRSSDHDGLVVYVVKDEDADGVPNDDDACPGTMIPESVPTNRLGINRWALVDDNGQFDTNPPEGEGPGLSFDLGDTAGCSCEQIIAVQGLGNGHTKFGCSGGEMEEWVALVNP